MTVYRIVKSRVRINDLSGTGAFRAGGRWNSKGTYLLYASENSSLAYLESLVHFSASDFPPHLYIVHLAIDDSAPIHLLPDGQYPGGWMNIGSAAAKKKGDQLINGRQWLAVKVRSAINTEEYNYLINPLFPGFSGFVKVVSSTLIKTDERLIG